MNRISRICKQSAKKCIAFLIYYSGIGDYILRKKTKGQYIVLMYHRILPARKREWCYSHNSITVTRKAFRKQMQLIRKKFNPVSVDDINLAIKTKTALPKRSILITMDDGWKDNYTYALPSLKELKIPALIFLSSGFIGQKKRFWQEKMVGLLRRAVKIYHNRDDFAPKVQAIFTEFDMNQIFITNQNLGNRRINDLVQLVKRYDYNEIDTFITKLENLVEEYSAAISEKSSDKVDDFLVWNEINEMHQQGICFGSHGVNHFLLDRAGVDVDYELSQSKREIQKKTGQPVTTFSYPNGNYNQAIEKKVRENGYQMAFSTKFGYNGPNANRFSLKRINIHQGVGSSIPLFYGRLIGIW